MIRIASVSYFNARPYTDGLRHWFGEDELQLTELPPAECAASLKNGDCDIALLPVGALADFEGITVMKDHCLGANGKVDSVFLLSHVPIKDADRLVLDPHSRSSNGLAAVLLQEYWERDLPLVVETGERFAHIRGRSCGVAIGDKAFAVKDQYPYVYDLADIWKRYSGLPFVFAVWAFRADSIAPELYERVRLALEWGRQNRIKSAQKWADAYGYSQEEAIRYLTECISFEFDAAKHEAMKKYFYLLLEVAPKLSAAIL